MREEVECRAEEKKHSLFLSRDPSCSRQNLFFLVVQVVQVTIRGEKKEHAKMDEDKKEEQEQGAQQHQDHDDFFDNMPTWALFQKMTLVQQRLQQLLGGKIVNFEGLIAVGKTTSLRYLTHYCQGILRLNVTPMYEKMLPETLAYFKQDAKRHAYATQLNMLQKRGRAMARASEIVRHDPNALVLMDRTLAGDMAFAYMHAQCGNIDEQAMAVYEAESKAMCAEEDFRTPLVTVYFKASIATLKNRIILRGDADDIQFYLHIMPDYLKQLQAAYDRTMQSNVLGCPVVEIQWEGDAECFNLSDMECCEKLLCRALGIDRAALQAQEKLLQPPSPDPVQHYRDGFFPGGIITIDKTGKVISSTEKAFPMGKVISRGEIEKAVFNEAFPSPPPGFDQIDHLWPATKAERQEFADMLTGDVKEEKWEKMDAFLARFDARDRPQPPLLPKWKYETPEQQQEQQTQTSTD